MPHWMRVQHPYLIFAKYEPYQESRMSSKIKKFRKLELWAVDRDFVLVPGTLYSVPGEEYWLWE